MSLTLYGDLVAHCPNNSKKYVRIGGVWKDERGEFVLKIDAFPAPHTGWQGFVNIKEAGKRPLVPAGAAASIPDDDIPF